MTERRRRAPLRRGAGAGIQRRYAVVKWALLAALIAYAVLVVGANSARNVDFAVIRSAIAAAPGVSGLKPLPGAHGRLPCPLRGLADVRLG